MENINPVDTLQEIASRFSCIPLNDMTFAEKDVANLLLEKGFLTIGVDHSGKRVFHTL
jgi:hypothetical protein